MIMAGAGFLWEKKSQHKKQEKGDFFFSFFPSQLNAPYTSAATYANPVAAVTGRKARRRPAYIVHLILTLPRCNRAAADIACAANTGSSSSSSGTATATAGADAATRQGSASRLALVRMMVVDAIDPWRGRVAAAAATTALATEQVPQQHERVVGARCQHAAPRRRPFNRVHWCCVAAQLQQRLARLPHVQDADDARVLRKSGEQMRVMGGS